MTRLRALIVDDEPPARRVLEILLSSFPHTEVINSVADGLDAMAVIAAEPVDVLLADIEMPDLSGLELVARLSPERAPAVIFVTAYAQHAVRAFELGAADYVMKPVSPDRLNQALERVERRAASTPRLWSELSSFREHPVAPTHIWVDVRGGRERIPIESIELLRAEDDYVRVVTAERSYLAAGPLDRLAAELGAGFLRVHRSTVVRLGAVRRVETDASRRLILLMSAGEIVTVSRRATGQVRSASACN